MALKTTIAAGSSSSGGSTAASTLATTAPYQEGTQIAISNNSGASNVTVYTVPAGKKFIGMIQMEDYREWSVNDVKAPRYINGIYGSSSVLYSVPNVKQHLVAGTVVKKYGSYTQYLNVLGVESDA